MTTFQKSVTSIPQQKYLNMQIFRWSNKIALFAFMSNDDIQYMY